EQASVETNILYIVTEDIVEKIQVGETAMVILQTTPFYAESGGQTADIGWIHTKNGKAKVTDDQTAPNGQQLHQVEIIAEFLKTNDIVITTIDQNYRKQVVKNHTATHI